MNYNKYLDFWNLSKDITFLNHGSFGATPKYILEKQRNYILEMESEPVDFLTGKLFEYLKINKSYLSDFINAKNDNLVFVQNSTTGVNQILNSLPAKPGDEWLTTSHTYGACLNALKHYAN